MTFGAVILANRNSSGLKNTLDSLESQSLKPEYIEVIDYFADSQAKEYLKKWKDDKGTILHLLSEVKKEIGTAGALSSSLKTISGDKSLKSEWIYIVDDMTRLDKQALQEISNADLFLGKDSSDILAYASAVYFENRLMLANHLKPVKSLEGIKFESYQASWYKKPFFNIDISTFIGLALKREALIKYGLPDKKLFAFYDDVEYSLRLSEKGRIVCIPMSKVFHPYEKLSKRVEGKDYYIVRNRLLVIKKYFSDKYVGLEAFKAYMHYLSLFGRIIHHCWKNNRKMMGKAIYDGKNGNDGISSASDWR